MQGLGIRGWGLGKSKSKQQEADSKQQAARSEKVPRKDYGRSLVVRDIEKLAGWRKLNIAEVADYMGRSCAAIYSYLQRDLGKGKANPQYRPMFAGMWEKDERSRWCVEKTKLIKYLKRHGDKISE